MTDLTLTSVFFYFHIIIHTGTKAVGMRRRSLRPNTTITFSDDENVDPQKTYSPSTLSQSRGCSRNNSPFTPLQNLVCALKKNLVTCWQSSLLVLLLLHINLKFQMFGEYSCLNCEIIFTPMLLWIA